ncbi:hypothetical protein EZS27_033815, partial [termite gut metagenome]
MFSTLDKIYSVTCCPFCVAKERENML